VAVSVADAAVRRRRTLLRIATPVAVVVALPPLALALALAVPGMAVSVAPLPLLVTVALLPIVLPPGHAYYFSRTFATGNAEVG
jgi:hypothetical protein